MFFFFNLLLIMITISKMYRLNWLQFWVAKITQKCYLKYYMLLINQCKQIKMKKFLSQNLNVVKDFEFFFSSCNDNKKKRFDKKYFISIKLYPRLLRMPYIIYYKLTQQIMDNYLSKKPLRYSLC